MGGGRPGSSQSHAPTLACNVAGCRPCPRAAEEIRDLLSRDQTRRLELRENVEKGVYVPDLSQLAVSGVAELETVLQVSG